MIQLVEVFNEVSSASRGTSRYNLREIYINPKHFDRVPGLVLFFQKFVELLKLHPFLKILVSFRKIL